MRKELLKSKHLEDREFKAHIGEQNPHITAKNLQEILAGIDPLSTIALKVTDNLEASAMA